MLTSHLEKMVTILNGRCVRQDTRAPLFTSLVKSLALLNLSFLSMCTELLML